MPPNMALGQPSFKMVGQSTMQTQRWLVQNKIMLELKNCSLLLCSPVNASNITFMVNKSWWKQTTSPWLQFRRNLSTQPQKDYSIWCYVCKSMTWCSPINLAKRSTLQMHSLVLCLIGHRNQVPHISVYRDLENVNFVEDLSISESTLAKQKQPKTNLYKYCPSYTLWQANSSCTGTLWGTAILQASRGIDYSERPGL